MGRVALAAVSGGGKRRLKTGAEVGSGKRVAGGSVLGEFSAVRRSTVGVGSDAGAAKTLTKRATLTKIEESKAGVTVGGSTGPAIGVQARKRVLLHGVGGTVGIACKRRLRSRLQSWSWSRLQGGLLCVVWTRLCRRGWCGFITSLIWKSWSLL